MAADVSKALAAAREIVAASSAKYGVYPPFLRELADLVAALDAARGEAVAWVDEFGNAYPLTAYSGKGDWQDDHKRHWRRAYAAPPAALAVPAANVTPMRQPRADLARLVESINAAVYANGDGLSVTEAIGALELAKLELLKEQEQ